MYPIHYRKCVVVLKVLSYVQSLFCLLNLFINSYKELENASTKLGFHCVIKSEIAKRVTDGLDGRGIFGVELFIKEDEVYFSEVSPRPHDTGMVTMISQSQSEFALHVRAILGLPLEFSFIAEAASAA
jgi:formate-dependent phosphoribosylglycinamide formyltransferase (GAR transformylase)